MTTKIEIYGNDGTRHYTRDSATDDVVGQFLDLGLARGYTAEVRTKRRHLRGEPAVAWLRQQRQSTASPVRPFWESEQAAVYCGDAQAVLAELPDASAQACVTSPPFWWARTYSDSQLEIGHEASVDGYIAVLVAVFGDLRRVLRPDGVIFVDLGDGHAAAGYANHRGTGGARRERGGKQAHTPRDGLAPKSLLGIPWRFARAMQLSGWILRSAIIWQKIRPQPDGRLRDRPACTYEPVFLFTQQTRYRYYPQPDARTDVWPIAVEQSKTGHPATMPLALADRCIRLASAPGDTVIDPFMGAGTTLLAAQRLGRKGLGIELSERYCELAAERLGGTPC